MADLEGSGQWTNAADSCGDANIVVDGEDVSIDVCHLTHFALVTVKKAADEPTHTEDSTEDSHHALVDGDDDESNFWWWLLACVLGLGLVAVVAVVVVGGGKDKDVKMRTKTLTEPEGVELLETTNITAADNTTLAGTTTTIEIGDDDDDLPRPVAAPTAGMRLGQTTPLPHALESHNDTIFFNNVSSNC